MITANRVENFDYQHWVDVARRNSRRASDAPDLLQDALIEAIRAARTNFGNETTRRWFAGVIRNRAAMMARTAARRNRRETVVAESDRSRSLALVPSDSFIDALPPSARRVAVLVIAGLSRDEIMAVLKIAPTAFRQRLTTIRRAWLKLPATMREELSIDAPSHVNGIDLGLLRRALLEHVKRLGGVGIHDPDGHLIVLSDSSSQTAPRRQQKRKEKRNG